MKAHLHSRWTRLTENYWIAPGLSDEIFEELAERYSEPHRAYHTLNHLVEVFALYDDVQDQFENPDAVAFALWAHDIIYVPTDPENEANSGIWAAEKMAEMGMQETLIETVVQQIEATKEHMCGDNLPDTQLLLDLDMAILAAAPERYREYVGQVMHEFGAESMPDRFLDARAEKFARPTLERERIFLRNEMHDKLEARARANLVWELTKFEGSAPAAPQPTSSRNTMVPG